MKLWLHWKESAAYVKWRMSGTRHVSVLRLASYLRVKNILNGDALLVEQGSCRLTAVMEDFDNIVILHQCMEPLELQVLPLLLHVKDT